MVDEVRALLLSNTFAQVLVILGVPSCDIGASQDDFSAHCPQVEYLFLAHLVRKHEQHPVTFLRSDKSKTDSGISRGRLDQQVTRLDIATTLGFFDHRYADPILYGTTGIHEFELKEQFTQTGVQTLYFKHRRLPNHLKNIGIDFHARIVAIQYDAVNN